MMGIRQLLMLGSIVWFCLPHIAFGGFDDIAKARFATETIIAKTEVVAGGEFQLPNGKPLPGKIPPFCRVVATLKPTPDSNIEIELWMPTENWNGKILATGNGGAAGAIQYRVLAAGVRRGYATVNTDMGTAPNGENLTDHPERWADFGFRATHEMTLAAKALVRAYYDQPVRHTYFVGASTGGQQALMAAQRYPDDYDGIVAGAPANNRTHLHAMFVWNWQAAHKTPDSFLTREKIALVTKAVLAAGAGKDGGAPTDNFLTDPRRCRFDPVVLLPPPRETEGADYLTQAQVAALKSIYSGPANPRTGEQIYSPPPHGSESLLLLGNKNTDEPPAFSFIFRWILGVDFDFRAFDFDKDLGHADQRLAPLLNANDPDLSNFQRRGGKLLMYAGTADAITPFQDAIDYYERVVATHGGLAKAQTFFRFFVVPGLGHVGGGPGLNDFGQSLETRLPQDSEHDILLALERWVEQGDAPERLVATAYNGGDPGKGIRFMRPIFPYPKFPEYIGDDPHLPGSFRAVEHERGGTSTIKRTSK
ncbi:hypothetical protein AW736_02335 [Termitidicoccus mucosus]|uniref:Tannase n=2 Tax=Termitidicoccus mucosus TaxID=1184151 RepID=A0A178IPK7_9BACT|nr:hypothetical protein AW736_02335 [Opitutaceae bacterium TSB47]